MHMETMETKDKLFSMDGQTILFILSFTHVCIPNEECVRVCLCKFGRLVSLCFIQTIMSTVPFFKHFMYSTQRIKQYNQIASEIKSFSINLVLTSMVYMCV